MNIVKTIQFVVFTTLISVTSQLAAQVNCTGCAPVFDPVTSLIVESCETLTPPLFPNYTTSCSTLGITEETFIATLGNKSTCEGSIAQTIGAGQDLCLSLYGFASAGLAPSDLFFVGSQPLQWTHYANGSATLSGLVYNDTDPSFAYNIDIYLEGGYNWTEWQAMGKQALDGLFQGTEASWVYFLMQNNISKLIGVGANQGQNIRLQHAPLSENLGFQLGTMGANNINLNNGLSGWITWEVLVGADTISGPGDVNIDLQNCQETVSDCANDNDILYRFFAGNLCGYDEVDITIDHIDTTAPTWTSFPIDQVLECSDVALLEDATASDICSSVSISLTTDTLFSTAVGNYIVSRIFTATDACGNSITDTQTIVFQDTTPPVLSIPADYSTECSITLTLEEATAYDNCGQVVITLLENTELGICEGAYTLTRTFTATDDAGNATSATQTITVVDSTAPVIITPSNLNLNCLDINDLGNAVASDLCSSVTLSVSSDTLLGSCPANYSITRTFTASDDCGNTNYGVQLIEYSDTIGPGFGNTPYFIELACTQDIQLDVEAYDSCSIVTDLSFIDLPGSGGCMTPSSNVVRVFTATDACGNLSSLEQTIQFIDTVSPFFTYIPSDIAIDCSVTIPNDFPIADDICSAVSLQYTIDTISSTTPHDLILSILWQAIDNCGNEAATIQLVTVSDTLAPTFTQLPILPDYLDFGISLPLCDSLQWSAVDNCYSPEELIFNCTLDTVFTEIGPCSGPFEIHYTYSISDPSGNSNQLSHIIFISDLTPPVWSYIPADVQYACNEEFILDEPIANGVNGIVWDMSFDTLLGICPNNYDIIRSMTPTDGCGFLGDTQIQTISITDTQAPDFVNLPSDVSISCEEEVPSFEIVVVDNCSESISLNDSTYITPGSCESNYVIFHELSAEDLCGNVVNASYSITVTDSIAPTFLSIPEDLVIELGVEISPCYEADIQISDDCSFSEWTCDEITEPGTCIGSTTILRTYTASDACGNNATSTQVILVVDTTAPEFTNFPSTSTLTCDGDTLSLVTDSLLGYDLGSPNNLVVTYQGSSLVGGDCSTENHRTYRITDNCGNSYDSVHVTILIDTIAPILNTNLEELSFTCLSDLPPCNETQLDISDNCNSISSFCADYYLDGDCETDACSIERVYTISDACNNILEVSQIILITESPLDSLCDSINSVIEPSALDIDAPKCIPYPNPTRLSSGYAVIDLIRCPESTPWVLLNSLGKQVAQGNSSQIRVENLTQGLYFLRSKGFGTQRIVVLK
ncbi:MAG: hypothetical protein COA49_06850 [Bacteroidetes bacterium]|nr:MAG: hypothetical protein COA49_06850 [Bacteroidota bacterium]